MLTLATKLIKRHEGCELRAYNCTEGFLTIGYGRNLDTRGISPDEAEYLLSNDIQAVVDDLETFPWWGSLAEHRQAALADLRFCVGGEGFRKFRRMIAALEAGDWDGAADEILDSKFAQQTGRRAPELAEIMRRD